MAKKKGRRSANVARKREKRKRDQKSRQKQIAVEKQRRLRYEKSEEEYLHACISQSQELLYEPEFEGVIFDPEMMYTRVIELLNLDEAEVSETPTSEFGTEDSVLVVDVVDEEDALEDPLPLTAEAEETCEKFQFEILPHLVTPEFMRRLGYALTACENRLKLAGNRRLAEVAYGTRSLFEAAPPHILAFHPMIQNIGIETLRALVEEKDLLVEWRDGVRDIFSDVLDQEDLVTYVPEQVPVFSSTGVEDTRSKMGAIEATPISSEVTEAVIAVEPPLPRVSPEELPARALYKNFKGLAIKACFEAQTDATFNYVLVDENEEHVEFFDIDNERYVKVTEERLQLHARSEAELETAMAAVEAACTSSLLYLAKTIEERG